MRIYRSRDLAQWSLAARPLDRVSQLDMRGNPDSGGVWAPALSYFEDTFWLVYSDVKAVATPWKNGCNYLVTAQNIEGPWSDPVPLGGGGFDPSLFHADDGRKFLLYRQWGPRHHSDPHNQIVMQEYFSDRQELSRERTILFTGTDRKFTEAPHIYKRGDYFYLLVAEGGTSFDHCVVVLRSRDLLGPYELHPDEVILSGEIPSDGSMDKSGHGSLLQTCNGDWYMAFLVGRPLSKEALDAGRSERPDANAAQEGYCPLGRETALARVEWHADWPYVVPEPAPSEMTSKASPAAHRMLVGDPTPTKDLFDAPDLHPDWQTLRIPFSRYLGEIFPDEGCLRLHGRDSLISRFDQSTIAQRWRHFSFDAEVSIEFFPTNSQQLAGLVNYYNTTNWSGVFVGYDDELKQPAIYVIAVDHGAASYWHFDKPIVLPDATRTLQLRTCVRAADYHYEYALDDNVWQAAGVPLASWKLSDDYVGGKGFFTGAFVGLHCSDMSGEGCSADFRKFSYSPM